MGHYEILALLVFLFASNALAYKIGHTLGGVNSCEYARQLGYSAAKELYFDRPNEAYREKAIQERAEQTLAEERMREHIAESQQPVSVTSEILMAYGVESTSQLPLALRREFGITEDRTIEDLIMEEVHE